MLVIRYNRVGRRNRAQYRVVVQEHTQAPGNRHVAIVGSYDPHTKEAQLKADEIKEWIGKGAQPSDSVWNLLVKENIVEGEKRKIKMRKKPAEETEGEESAAKAEGDVKKEEGTDDAKTDDAKEDAPAEEVKEEAKEEIKEEVKEETPAKEEKPADDAKKE